MSFPFVGRFCPESNQSSARPTYSTLNSPSATEVGIDLNRLHSALDHEVRRGLVSFSRFKRHRKRLVVAAEGAFRKAIPMSMIVGIRECAFLEILWWCLGKRQYLFGS